MQKNVFDFVKFTGLTVRGRLSHRVLNCCDSYYRGFNARGFQLVGRAVFPSDVFDRRH